MRIVESLRSALENIRAYAREWDERSFEEVLEEAAAANANYPNNLSDTIRSEDLSRASIGVQYSDNTSANSPYTYFNPYFQGEWNRTPEDIASAYEHYRGHTWDWGEEKEEEEEILTSYLSKLMSIFQRLGYETTLVREMNKEGKDKTTIRRVLDRRGKEVSVRKFKDNLMFQEYDKAIKELKRYKK